MVFLMNDLHWKLTVKTVNITDSYNITIGDWVFFSCQSLITVILEKSVRTTGNYAFYNCKDLICIYFYGETTPTIGTNAFDGIEAML